VAGLLPEKKCAPLTRKQEVIVSMIKNSKQYVRFHQLARENFFEYNWYSWASNHVQREWWLHTMRCARLWAQGKYKEAKELGSER
jgi:hypothetical protein